jgi:hypothetical protein
MILLGFAVRTLPAGEGQSGQIKTEFRQVNQGSSERLEMMKILMQILLQTLVNSIALIWALPVEETWARSCSQSSAKHKFKIARLHP